MSAPNDNGNQSETNDWLLRVGDGINFIESSREKIWGIDSKSPAGKHFLKIVKPGDRLWFVINSSHGKLLAVATYRLHNERVLGTLLNLTKTNEELGWTPVKGDDLGEKTEIHYTNLYNLSKCELLTHINSPLPIRLYNEKCRIVLPLEYLSIERYSKVTSEF